MNSTKLTRTATVAGPVVAFVLAASTASIRDQVGASNVGIALAMVVVLAALISRGAGLATAAVAALSFNFFHTEPYHSLRIHKARDVLIVALLVVVGLVVSDISAWRRRREVIANRHTRATNAPATISELTAANSPVAEVWPAVVTAIMDQLSLATCRIERQQPLDLPVISRIGARGADLDDGFILPTHGAAMAILSGGETIGYLVITPPAGAVSLRVERRVLVALADHLALALTYGSQQPPQPRRQTYMNGVR